MFYSNDDDSEKEIAKAAGSPAFLAPEICGLSDSASASSKEPPIDPYALDIWAMGVTLFCFIFGQVPFTGNSEFEVFHAINNQTYVSKRALI